MQRMIGILVAVMMLAACGDGEETGNGGVGAAGTASEEASVAAATEAAGAVAPVAPVASDELNLDIVYGDPNAAIEIIEYASMTCPHCANFSTSIFPRVKEKYIDTGKAKFIFRNLVVNRIDLAAAATARCSNQEVARELVKVYFAEQQTWGRSQNPIDELASLARRAGVSRTQFDRCLANVDLHQALVKAGQDGVEKYKINGTPTIVVNGVTLDNYGYDTIEKAVEDAS